MKNNNKCKNSTSVQDIVFFAGYVPISNGYFWLIL